MTLKTVSRMLIANKMEETIKTMQQELEMLKLHCSELESTNNHLISATWRERDLKKKLADTLEELNKTKEIVENQNKRITESINYARKIQLAINPTENDLRTHFPESFILYLPKDVISGDFPWLYETTNFIYLAAVDCTGHGVPGAMMSMIGNLLLNDIVNGAEDKLPSDILLNLHHAVVNTLKQNNGSNSNDGMDIGLCRIDKRNNELIYSGAHRPLFIKRMNGTVETVSGDKFPIGGIQYKNKNKYTDNIISIHPSDSIYLFTDGLPDQIGGDEKKKLTTRNLMSLLENHNSDQMTEMKLKILEIFSMWKGSNKQIDDVLMIGIKFQ